MTSKEELIKAVDHIKLSFNDEMTAAHAFQFLRGFATCQMKVIELLMNMIPDETDPVPVPDADPKADPKPKPAKNDGMPKIDHAKIVTLWKAGEVFFIYPLLTFYIYYKTFFRKSQKSFKNFFQF